MKYKVLVVISISTLLIIGLLYSMTQPHTVQAQSLTQWEYKTVHLFLVKTPGGTFGSKAGIDEDGSPTTTKMLNDLGAQGWELVGFNAEGLGSAETVLIFKRPKQ